MHFLSFACFLLIQQPDPITPNGNWPQWRGPTGDSVTPSRNLPTHWSNTENIVWKTPLPGWGTSTPAIWGDAVFVTTQEDDRLLFLRLDARTRQDRLAARGRQGDATPQGPGRQWPLSRRTQHGQPVARHRRQARLGPFRHRRSGLLRFRRQENLVAST